MPKFKHHELEKKPKKLKSQETTSGIYVSAGEIDHSDYDKKDWLELQEDYTKIRNGNALASTTIDILKFPILMSDYRIEGENAEVRGYVEYVYENLYKSFDYLRRHKLLALDYGLAMHEMVVERNFKFNGKSHTRPYWFNPIQNETIDMFIYNEYSIFAGIKHEKRVPDQGTEFVEIDTDRLEWYTFMEEHNDVRGRSLFRTIRMLNEARDDILRARVNGIQRGAGIPYIKTKGEPSSSDQTKIQQIGRTIGRMKDGYIALNEERMTIELLEPKGQGDAMPLMEWIDRQIVFNTLSQFMVAGIGQNGSRSSTEEHRNTYEMAATVILKSLERNFQELTNRIVAMSAYAKIPSKEYPRFHFKAITQADLEKVAGNMKSLFDSKLVTKQREDEKFLRETFGMPELKVTTEMIKPEDSKISMFEKPIKSKSLSKKKERKVSDKVLEYEKEVFCLQSAIDHYEEMELSIAKALDESFHEYITDIQTQLKSNRKKEIHIRKSIQEGLKDKLLDLYEKGFDRGETDIVKELSKISKRELSISKKDKISKKKVIDKLVTKMFFNVKTAVENKMETVSDEYIKNKGGLNEVLTGFELGFKREKDNIKSVSEGGYVDGRGQAMIDRADEIELYLYTAVMDANTCNECSPFDGETLTLEELKDNGLNRTHPVNPNCLGQERDRCQLIVFKTVVN